MALYVEHTRRRERRLSRGGGGDGMTVHYNTQCAPFHHHLRVGDVPFLDRAHLDAHEVLARRLPERTYALEPCVTTHSSRH